MLLQQPVVWSLKERHSHAHYHTHHLPHPISSSPRSSAYDLPLRITNNIVQGAESDIEENISDEEGRTIITNEHVPHVVRYKYGLYTTVEQQLIQILTLLQKAVRLRRSRGSI
jgi:hypothetical protein